jgi:hypothetical protein
MLNLRSIVIVIGLGLVGCGTSTSARDGGGGGGTGGGGATDMAGMSSGDLAGTCNQPGMCGNGGVCCVRSTFPLVRVFCDTANSCPLEHGLDTAQSPLCGSPSECYAAAPADSGTLYCCPLPSLPGVKTCRSSACP